MTENPGRFIYVPSADISVVGHRLLLGMNYDQSQKEIVRTKEQGEKLSILTPYQFRGFLRYLRDSEIPEDQEVFRDITQLGLPSRANWLNARFEKRGSEMYMISENVLEKGGYVTKEQRLEDFLEQNETFESSLNNWINSNTPHGLPSLKGSKGRLCFWHPESGKAVGFWANLRTAYLHCLFPPSGEKTLRHGVFAYAEGDVTKK